MIEAGWDSWNPQEMNDTHKIYELYGDKILISVMPTISMSKIQPRRRKSCARAYAEKFCRRISRPP